jgi:hypothetical protein
MRLLDILFATLVLFPLLAGAAWFDMPGVSLTELSDFGVPLLAVALVAHVAQEGMKAFWMAAAVASSLLAVVVVGRYLELEHVARQLTYGPGAVSLIAAVAVAVRRFSDEPWDVSFFVRQGAKLANAWVRALERAPARSLWSAAAAIGAVLLWVAVMRHRAYFSHGFDLGIFTNTIWNLTHGNGYISSVKGGINLFADHQSPLFWLLTPLFALVPRPETLLFAQAFGLAAGGPALYYLGRAQFGRGHWAPAALPWLYWCYLPLRNANAFDFHPEVFMLPLFLWAFAGFASERRAAKALGILALLGALAAKESAGVVAFGIGIAWALTGGNYPRRNPWPGIALAVAGVAVVLFDVRAVPRFFGEEYAYIGLYDRFGGGIVDVVLAPFTQPVYFFSQVLNGERLNFLFWTLGPLGFLPLVNWRAALAAIPPYLVLFLSEGDQRVRVVFHYGIEPGTALFWALPLGLAGFAARFGWRWAGIWMFFWALACLGPSELERARNFRASDHARWLTARVLPCLNTQAPTAASDVLIPHLAARRWISYPGDLRQRPSGEPVSCVVTDLELGNWPLGSGGVERALAALPGQGYREAWKCRSFSVYERGDAGCLRCVPNCF